MTKAFAYLALAGLAVSWAGCERADRRDPAADGEFVPLVEFGAGTVRIESDADTFELSVEIAERDEQRSYGLMERPYLAEDAGMIFLYDRPQPAGAGFWMYRTRIPLDIAFLDEDGRIVAVEAMEPCESPDPRWCPIYSPGVPYQSALEVNRGYFAARGIGPGDRVVLRRNGDGSVD